MKIQKVKCITDRITGNSALERGGGIYCTLHSNPVVKQSVIENNTAVNGGGIYSNNSGPLLDSVDILNNTAEHYGGGLCCMSYSSGEVKNSTIADNSAEMGGGLYCTGSSLKLDNLIIENNVASSYGGGIDFMSSEPELGELTVTGNMALFGGGIYCKGTDAHFEDAFISNNIAEKGGGCYFLQSDPKLNNVLLSDNAASIEGGGMRCSSSNPVLVNVTITGNYAEEGGGISCTGSAISVWNSIIWNESSEEVYFTPLYYPSSFTSFYSDIQGGEDGILTNGNGTLNWMQGNIAEYPVFEGMGENPYALSAGSPCIDTGTPDTTGLNLPLWDILGNQRIWDGDGDGVAVVDMGAYEAGSVTVGTEENGLQVSGCRLQVSSYPNPTYGRSEIKYQIAESKNVVLTVMDIRGAVIATLVNENQEAGEYIVPLDGSTYPAGIYLIRLESGEEISTSKLVVMR